MSRSFGRVSVFSAGVHGMRINVDMPSKGLGEESARELARDLAQAIASAWPVLCIKSTEGEPDDFFCSLETGHAPPCVYTRPRR